jgi:hypothetical protein
MLIKRQECTDNGATIMKRHTHPVLDISQQLASLSLLHNKAKRIEYMRQEIYVCEQKELNETRDMNLGIRNFSRHRKIHQISHSRKKLGAVMKPRTNTHHRGRNSKLDLAAWCLFY